jgi:RNA polymerase subunit RPABC4/transcription elongation factor Spt4
LKCPACKSEIPDDSKFCLSCGRPIKPEGFDMILPPEGSHTQDRAMIYMMLAIMCLFFGLFLLIPGYFVGLGLMIPASILVVIGAVFLVARYYVLRHYAEHVEKLREESAIRVRCRYCGSLNPQEDEKCIGCGAPLT